MDSQTTSFVFRRIIIVYSFYQNGKLQNTQNSVSGIERFSFQIVVHFDQAFDVSL